MRPPVLTRQLVLEAPVRIPDGSGGYGPGWAVRGVLWAAIEARTGRETAGAGAALSRVDYRITLRAAPHGSDARPGPDHRLREGARVFRVLAVAEADAQGRYLVCTAQEEVST